MKNRIRLVLCLTTLIFVASSCGPDVPAIEATEKKAVENFIETETEVSGSVGDEVDSLVFERKKKLAESANNSPHQNKNCDEILIWLETTVKRYVSTGDTTALNSFISIENDVIFNSCLQDNNQEFRKKYEKIVELLE